MSTGQLERALPYHQAAVRSFLRELLGEGVVTVSGGPRRALLWELPSV